MNFRLNDDGEWSLSREYQHVATWSNAEVERQDFHFEFDLAVALVHPESGYAKNPAIRTSGQSVERFVVDTGANVSVITKALAEKLGLNLDASPREATFVDGKRVPVVDSKIFANIGDKWVELPCIILETPRSENLLGLAGLFDRFLFALDRSEFTLFERSAT